MYRYVDTLQYTIVCIEEVFEFFLNKIIFWYDRTHDCSLFFYIVEWSFFPCILVIFSYSIFIINFQSSYANSWSWIIVSWWTNIESCFIYSCWWMMKWHWYYFNILVTLDLIVGAGFTSCYLYHLLPFYSM
jgi:hypothetical protein